MAEAHGYDPAVVDLIVRFAETNGLPADLALAIALAETGGTLDVNAAGDHMGGVPTSFGIIQIHTLPAAGHGGTRETWTGLEGAARSLEEMRWRWQQNYDPTWATLDTEGKIGLFHTLWPQCRGACPRPSSSAAKPSRGRCRCWRRTGRAGQLK